MDDFISSPVPANVRTFLREHFDGTHLDVLFERPFLGNDEADRAYSDLEIIGEEFGITISIHSNGHFFQAFSPDVLLVLDRDYWKTIRERVLAVYTVIDPNMKIVSTSLLTVASMDLDK